MVACGLPCGRAGAVKGAGNLFRGAASATAMLLSTRGHPRERADAARRQSVEFCALAVDGSGGGRSNPEAMPFAVA
jgi:hypothetical protein